MCLKDAAFQPSSPLRHACELGNFLSSEDLNRKPSLCIYTDGGPDHHLTYLSVKVSLLCLFLLLDLDYLLAARTALCHSWRNLVERIMSTLNLGLQCVGLQRQAGDEKFEAEAHNCNSLSALRRAAAKRPEFRSEALDSIEPVKCLVSSIFSRLKLKDKHIKSSAATEDEQMSILWNFLSTILADVPSPDDLHKKSDLSSFPPLSRYLDHCTQRHYFFEIKKCGVHTCGVCKPIRLPREIFEQLKPFPDTMPGSDGHFMAFEDMYGSDTTEKHRPSSVKKSAKHRSLPFHGKLQHVKNANLMIECDECGMWRLVYALRKLNSTQCLSLQNSLSGMSFSCGAPLQELDIIPELRDLVFVRTLACGDPIEVLYYTAKFEPICIYCAQSMDSYDSASENYPQCDSCDKPAIKKSNFIFCYSFQEKKNSLRKSIFKTNYCMFILWFLVVFRS